MSNVTLGCANGLSRVAACRAIACAWVVMLGLHAGSTTLAQEAAKDAGNAAPAATAGTTAQRKSLLDYLLRAHRDPLAAAVGLLLLGLSIYFFAQVIRFFMEFRVTEAVPPALVDKIENAIKEKKFQEAYDACRDDNSYLARLLRTGIANLPNGRAEAKEAMNVASEEIVVTMESRISY